MERGLNNFLFFDVYLVVASIEIEFGENLGTMNLISKIIKDSDRELILNGELIKGSKVKEHPLITFFI